MEMGEKKKKWCLGAIGWYKELLSELKSLFYVWADFYPQSSLFCPISRDLVNKRQPAGIPGGC